VIDFADFPLRRDPALPSWFLNEGTEVCEKRRREWLRDGIVTGDYPDPVAADWPDLLEIVERRVKPQRQALPPKNAWNREVAKYWWLFGAKRIGLYRAIAPLQRVLVRSLTSTQFPTFAFLQGSRVYDQTLIVWATQEHKQQALLSSRAHEIWGRFLGATMKDDNRYNIADCFETFPFPEGFETDPALEAAGRAYHDHRAALMVARNEGMTKTYNRFHEAKPTLLQMERALKSHDNAKWTVAPSRPTYPSCGDRKSTCF